MRNDDLRHLPIVGAVAALCWFIAIAALYWLIPGFSPGY